MFEMLLAIYLAGIAIGMMVMRDRWPERVVTALAWPLGPVAFAVVVVTLVAAATYLWPIPVLATISVLLGAWYMA